ncbi:hypothetical protein GCM10009412_33040 [Aeromonas salmonicida subsp. achromogenes]
MNASLYVVSIRHQSAASFLDPEQVLRRVAQFPTSEKQPHTRLFSSLVRAGVRRDSDRKKSPPATVADEDTSGVKQA